MQSKKILITTGIVVAIAAPLITAIAITVKPQVSTPSTTYLMSYKLNENAKKNLDPNKINEFKKNQEYLDFLKSQVNEVFNTYSNTNKSFKDLELEFIFLSKTLTSGQINFFNELNKALMEINPNLKFKMIQRNNITNQQGAIDKNIEMVSFYWSPDYNDIGTWMTYIVSEFQVPNVWPTIAALINNNNNSYSYNLQNFKSNWLNSLIEKFQNTSLNINGNSIPIVDSNKHALTLDELYKYKNQDNNISMSSIFSTISNAISSWTNDINNKRMTGTIDASNDKFSNNFKNCYNNYLGGFKIDTTTLYTPSNLTTFLDFINSFNLNIPYIQDGPTSETISLVKNGAHVPNNPETNYDCRDWYYAPSKFNKTKFIDWNKNNPFNQTSTPFNPSFTRLSNATYMSTIFTPLFSWSSYGDFYNENNGESKSLIHTNLIANGSNASVSDIETKISNLTQTPPPSGSSQPTQTEKILEIPIRPLKWINSSGQTGDTIYYLSPADFLAGFKSYRNSIKVGLNHNNYFLDLASIDIEATINDSKNNERNMSEKDTKPFYIHFNDNIQLSPFNIVDILSMQYFTALPAFVEKVQNIIDETKFKQITGFSINDKEKFDPSASYMEQFYGCGDHRKAYKDLWTTSAYYISDVNDQTYTYKLNKEFFNSFKQLAEGNESYKSFLLTTDYNGEEIKKFDEIEFKYASAYNPQVALEQFKNNELDRTDIPLSERSNVLNSIQFKNDIYKPHIFKVNKTDLIPYNLMIFQLKDGLPILIDDKGNESNDYNKLGSDVYGNIILPPGYKFKLKSKIPQTYYDLIYKNFYTPIDARGDDGNLLPAIDRSSAIIRTAINDLINWYSLLSIIYPSENKGMQNSFTPYGVANMILNTDNPQVSDSARLETKYWNLAAYKVGQQKYLNDIITQQNFNKGIIRNTPGGNVEWTWLQYIEQWYYKLKGVFI